MLKTPENSVVLEFVNKIFLDYSPQYHSIKKIAERDLGQELIDKIHEFLKDREKSKPVKSIKKIVFENASIVEEEDINDIVDAFIKMRSQGTLGEIDNKSINDILILFNQWIMIGKDQGKGNLPNDIYFSSPNPEANASLEQQIMQMEPNFRNQAIYPDFNSNDLYSDAGTDFYESLAKQGEFYFGQGDNKSVYESKATYKAQRSSF